MKTSESISELAPAFALAQGAFPEIPRNRTVRVTLKAGGTYTFAYATLDAILDAVRKPLAEHGLSLTCYMTADEKGDVCVSRLLHSSGQWMECYFPIIVESGADAQRWGSGLTYAKRNSIACLLALHADEDDDGNAAAGHELEPVARASRQPAARANGKLPPVHRTAPPTAEATNDAERFRRIKEYAVAHAADLLTVLTDTNDANGRATFHSRMQLFDSPVERRKAEAYLCSHLQEKDRVAYLEFLMDRYNGRREELEWLGQEISRQPMDESARTLLIEKGVDYLNALMIAS